MSPKNRSSYNKEYYKNNRERLLSYQKAYYQENRADVIEYNRVFREENKESIREQRKGYRLLNSGRIKEYARGWHENNKEQKLEHDRAYYQENREAILERERERASRFPQSKMWKNAKNRARQAGIPFRIEEKDIVIPEVCPILGIPIVRKGKEKSDNSPSLDRIIPELGYVEGNIAVISDRANTIKNNGTWEEHERVADWIDRERFSLCAVDSGSITKSYRSLMFSRIKSRAKKRNLPFDLDITGIVVPEFCPILGLRLSPGRGKCEPGSPSVDQIIPSKGYVKGNVAVLSWRANTLKNVGTGKEHQQISDWIRAMTLEKTGVAA